MKTVTYQDFIKKAEDSSKRKRIPLNAMFDLTYKCNHRCIYCYAAMQKGRRELTTKQICSIIDDLAYAGCLLLTVSGGEPFVRDDIIEILSHIRKRGISIKLLTNGSLIDEKTAEFLKKMCVRKVEITLLGATEKVFDSISCCKGSFARVIRAISALVNNNIPLHVKGLIMKENQHEFLQMKELLARLGIDDFKFEYALFPKINRDKSPLSHRMSAEEGESLLGGNTFAINTGNQERRKVFDQCSAGKNACTINAYGDMQLCPLIAQPRFSILKSSFLKCWDNLVDFVENYTTTKDYECLHCDLKPYCYFCPGVSLLETGSFEGCVTLEKAAARIKKRRHLQLKKGAKKGNSYEKG